MKHIKIDIKTVDCDKVYAWATVYDCNYNQVLRAEIDYPSTLTEEEIVDLLNVNDYYSFKADHIVGGGIKRPR